MVADAFVSNSSVDALGVFVTFVKFGVFTFVDWTDKSVMVVS